MLILKEGKQKNEVFTIYQMTKIKQDFKTEGYKENRKDILTKIILPHFFSKYIKYVVRASLV